MFRCHCFGTVLSSKQCALDVRFALLPSEYRGQAVAHHPSRKSEDARINRPIMNRSVAIESDDWNVVRQESARCWGLDSTGRKDRELRTAYSAAAGWLTALSRRRSDIPQNVQFESFGVPKTRQVIRRARQSPMRLPLATIMNPR